MIEKLDLDKRNSFGTLDWLEHWNEPSGAKLIEEKVNQLVDVVNELTSCVGQLGVEFDNYDTDDIAEVKNENLYTEQHKWIGTLCRCWDSNINDDVWGILQDIKDNKTEKYYMYGIGYEHCEPVKPDDDIIYKG